MRYFGLLTAAIVLFVTADASAQEAPPELKVRIGYRVTVDDPAYRRFVQDSGAADCTGYGCAGFDSG